MGRDSREKFLISLFDGLWERYRSRVKHARRYEELAKRNGARFRNDHIAFRTIAWQEPGAGIFSISRLFESLGYVQGGCYEFPDKHLSSIHYQHPDRSLPKLFISQLKSWELSAASRKILESSLKNHRAPLKLPVSLKEAERCFAELPWPLPQKKDVLALNKESQFGAWVLVNGYDVNHFTAAVDDIEETVAAMKAAGIPMKAEIEGARATPLRQSSTEAVMSQVAVMEKGRKTSLPWTYAYFELAQRAPGFEGFLGGQATNLFEMTKVK